MTIRNRQIRAPFALTALCLWLMLGAGQGCRRDAPGKGATGGSPSGNAQTPVRGGTVVTGWISEPNGVNRLIVPASQVTADFERQILLGLAEEQPDYQDHPPTFKPQLAKSWEFSPDRKTLTFHLREDVVWSDGIPITADDVRWTWKAQTDPDVAWEAVDKKAAISDVEVVDPHTVRFHFTRVSSSQMLDVNEGQILPKHVWEQIPFAKWRQSGDWFKSHVVASGPFTLQSWTPQQEVVLKRNERYFQKDRPYLDRVVLRVVPDQAGLLTQLLAGDLDFIPQIAPADAPRVKAKRELELIPYWFNLYVFVGWNNARAPFDDPEVRRALSLGIDRQEIVSTLLGDLGRIATSPVPSIFWAHDRSIQPLPYDPEGAKKILAAKGWRDSDGDGVLDKGGKPFSFELISNAGNQVRNDAVVMIQGQLKKIGVRAEPHIVEFNSLLDQTSKGTFQAAILGYGADTGLDLRSNFHSKAIDEANYVRYKNAKVDQLIEKVATVPDLLEAKPSLFEIQQQVVKDQPMTFLWESQRLTAVNRRVHNLHPTPQFSLFGLQDWWIEPKK